MTATWTSRRWRNAGQPEGRIRPAALLAAIGTGLAFAFGAVWVRVLAWADRLGRMLMIWQFLDRLSPRGSSDSVRVDPTDAREFFIQMPSYQ